MPPSARPPPAPRSPPRRRSAAISTSPRARRPQDFESFFLSQSFESMFAGARHRQAVRRRRGREHLSLAAAAAIQQGRGAERRHRHRRRGAARNPAQQDKESRNDMPCPPNRPACRRAQAALPPALPASHLAPSCGSARARDRAGARDARSPRSRRSRRKRRA